MRLRQWLLAGALAVGGCAHGGVVPENEVARLPMQDRAQIVTAHRSIDVAEQNLGTARVARDEAKQFRKIAMSDLDAAKSKLDAARTGMDLGRTAGDDRTLREATRNEQAARNDVIAARAKVDYANRLLELREAKVDEADSAVEAARADVEVTKLRMVEQHGASARVDARAIEQRRQDAQERLAEQRARVANLEGEVAQLKTAWDDRRADVASARSLAAPPPPPAPLPAPRHPASNYVTNPRGDVNDTPAAPEVKDAQQPQNNIAPAP